MSNSPFDFNLPFSPFSPFAAVASPAQRWLDMFAGNLLEGAAAAAWPPALRNLFAGLADPFKGAVQHADAPAWTSDWANACQHASAVLSKAQARLGKQQMELYRSWLDAPLPFAPAGGDAGPQEQLEWLRQQTTQNLAQYRSMVDEYLEDWFAAAGIVADAWQAAQAGPAHDGTAAKAASGSAAAKPAPRTSRAANRRR